MEKNNITKEKIFEEIQRILKDKLSLDKSELTLEASLPNDLGADSLDTVEIKMEVERDLNIIISAEYDDSLITIEDFVNFTFNYLTKGAESNKKEFEILS